MKEIFFNVNKSYDVIIIIIISLNFKELDWWRLIRHEKAAIIGIGDLPLGKYPEYDVMELASLVISKALNDSGLKKDKIEGFIAGPDALVGDMFFTAW